MKESFFQSVILAFVLCIISPLMVVDANPNDFTDLAGIGYLKSAFIYMAACSAILFLANEFLRLAGPKKIDVRYFFLIMISLWSLYMPVTHGKLDGIDVMEISYSFIFVGLLIATTLTAWKRYKILVLLALYAGPLIQSLLISFSILSDDFITQNNAKDDITQHKIVPLSQQNNNILVISFDALESKYVREIIAEDQKLKDKFSGFLNYSNVTGVAPHTLLSTLTTKLGAVPDTNITTNQFVNNYKSDFITSFYLDAGYSVETYSSFNRGESAGTVNKLKRHSIYETQEADYTSSLIASLYRSIPSEKLIIELQSLLQDSSGSEFEMNLRRHPHPLAYYKLGTLHFDSFIKQLDSSKDALSSFRMHHYVFTHDPLLLTPNCEYAQVKVNREQFMRDETRCALLKMSSLIDKLNILNAFDNSMIVFISDHGYEGGLHGDLDSGSYDVSKRWSLSRYQPFMMIKPINSTKPYSLSEKSVSLEDLAKTLCRVDGSLAECEKYSGFNVLGDENITGYRNLLVSKTSEDVRDYSGFDILKIPRDITLQKYFDVTDNLIEYLARDLPSQVGSVVGTSREAKNGANGHLILGPHLSLNSGDYQIELAYEYGELTDENKKLSTWELTYNKGNVIEAGVLTPENNDTNSLLDIDFQVPEPIGGVELRVTHLGNGNLKINTLRIKKVESTSLRRQELNDSIECKKLYKFTDVYSPIHPLSGFSTTESWGRWSNARESNFGFNTAACLPRTITLKLSAYVNEKHRIQDAIVSLNGHEITEITVNYGDKRPITLHLEFPKKYINPSSLNVISFKYSNSASPSSLGLSTDGRLLSFGFISAYFNEEE